MVVVVPAVECLVGMMVGHGPKRVGEGVLSRVVCSYRVPPSTVSTTLLPEWILGQDSGARVKNNPAQKLEIVICIPRVTEDITLRRHYMYRTSDKVVETETLSALAKPPVKPAVCSGCD